MRASYTYSSLTVILTLFVTAMLVSGIMIPLEKLSYTTPVFFSRFIDFEQLTDTSSALSTVIGILFVLATALLLMPIIIKFSNGLSRFVPMIYLAITLANPYALHFSPYHVAALCIAAAFFQYASITVTRGQISRFFTANLMIAIAVCFIPQLIWIQPVTLPLILSNDDDIKKEIVAAGFSFIFPFAVIFAVNYMVFGIDDTTRMFSAFLSECVHLKGKPEMTFKISSAVRIAVCLIAVTAAVLHTLRNIHRFSIIKSRIYTRLIIYIPVFMAFPLIFCKDLSHPHLLLVTIPSSIIVNEAITSHERTQGAGIFVTIWVLICIVERISFFI